MLENTGEAAVAGYTEENVSWRNPGRVSSSVRTAPPGTSAASSTVTARPARASAMEVLLRHRLYLVRELVLMLKVCACMAMFRSCEVRARTGYDVPDRAVRLRVLPTQLTPEAA